MAINSAPLNSYPINGAIVLFSGEIISESVLFTEALPTQLLQNGALIDNIVLIEKAMPGWNGTLRILESVLFIDSITVILNGSLIDLFNFQDIISEETLKIGVILEQLSIDDETITIATRVELLNEVINLLDNLEFHVLEIITETLLVADSAKDIGYLVNAILETVNVTGLVEANREMLDSIADGFVMTDIPGTQGIYNNLLSDIIRFFVTGGRATHEFIAYILSPETNSVSTYSNYNFTGSAIFNGKQLLINEDGLHERGGVTDIGEEIIASIKTAAMDFGTPHLKRCLNLYLGLQNSNRLVLKVAADGRQQAYYEITRPTVNLETQRITIGKGLFGRYWQFELITKDNTEFELESLDFLPLVLSRRI